MPLDTLPAISLPSQYQQYVHLSRYSRFIYEENRREFWHETVARYFAYMGSWLKERHDFNFHPEFRRALELAVLNLEVMPSMRCLMTAGPALAQNHIAGYNCSYVPIDDPAAFAEIFLILMNGTGVGFSVERQFIANLPEIPKALKTINRRIVVEDSKEGWVEAYNDLIVCLYGGAIPYFDVSKVRLAGTPLKTFGGRASGPEPLLDLFAFTIDIFKKAVGRRLNSLEVHDIATKIGEIVVVGGVRRSAMISLSNLSDERMRHAKDGRWFEIEPQRSLANNSVAYTERPEVFVYLQEMLALYGSKSGERGIFNRVAAQNKARSIGRDAGFHFGTNPCGEILLRPAQFCNLTEIVANAADSEADLIRKCEIATILGTFQSTLTDIRGLRKLWTHNTESERLLGVSITGIMDHPILSGRMGRDRLYDLLRKMRETARQTNKEYATLLGIPVSAAITCVKPSGTVSQLVNSASGIHPRYSRFYTRRIRSDLKDPLTQFMMEAGVPHEPCHMKGESVMIFSFPVAGPENAIFRQDFGAVDQLELWLDYQKVWCDHNPSTTIHIQEHEWPAVINFVWENFDQMAGLAFLPYDSGSYRQAPYEEITEEAYRENFQAMPILDWVKLKDYEDQGLSITGAKEFACVSGSCDIL